MAAAPGRLPEGPAWRYEMKWDGVRALATVTPDGLRLTGRRGTALLGGFTELDPLADLLLAGTVVDGEIVAFGSGGAPSFEVLQERMHVGRPPARLLERVPVVLLAFDLLALAGEPTTGVPYDERRALLDGLGLAGASWQTPPAFDGPGSAVLAAARAQQLEGVVAKRRDSTYTPGRRSDAWVKVKLTRRQELAIVGWEPGDGSRAGHVGAVLLALADDSGTYAYAGQAGSGLSEPVLRVLEPRLAALRSTEAQVVGVPPEVARAAVWVRPGLVAEVRFTEWTREGRLRHPVFLGLRDDVDPAAVRREP